MVIALNYVEKQKSYDFKDIQIIKTIDESKGSKISTEEISKKLGIPSRSIRYRITKLKDQGILNEKTIIAHERKLGIREYFIVVEENQKNREKFQTIISENVSLSWYVPTTGKYNGFIVHAINSIDVPEYPLILMEKMKEKGIISDFFLFELLDYQELGWNYDYFNLEGNWVWNWDIWKEQITKGIRKNKFELEFDENPELTNFDYLDVQILKNLYQKEGITQKELSGILELSESQISRRIKSLESNGIIRGYRTGFNPFENTLTILLIFKFSNNLKEIIGYLNQIPFPRTFAYNDKNTIGFAIRMPIKELEGLLNGIHLTVKLNPNSSK